MSFPIRMLVIVFAAMLPAVVHAQGDGPKEIAKDQAKLQGSWRIAPGFKGELSLSPDGAGWKQYVTFVLHAVAGKEIEFKGDTLLFPDKDEKSKVEVKLTLDPAASPKTIIGKNTDGDVAFQGVYAFDGDAIVLCVSRKGMPKELKHSGTTPLLRLQRPAAVPPKDSSSAAPPSPEQVRSAVERSLPFLLTGGELWREGKTEGGQNGRVCVTCHQIPFTIWPHNEAKARGIKIEQKRLDDLTEWALDWCSKQKHPKTQAHTGGFLSTMQQMIMGRSATPPDKTALETYQLFGKVMGEMQKPEGWWREGNQIQGKAGEREADEVDTLWIILGLASLEKLALPKETIDASVKSRERGVAWLKEGKPATRTDGIALRMLLERDAGRPTEELHKQLLAQQNADGGWPLVKGEPSHPLVTGQAIYALDIVGAAPKDAFERATKFLLGTQDKDGSWKAKSRNNAASSNIVTIHWATGWATIGLARTLPFIK